MSFQAHAGGNAGLGVAYLPKDKEYDVGDLDDHISDCGEWLAPWRGLMSGSLLPYAPEDSRD